jgi:hypothetical protein
MKVNTTSNSPMKYASGMSLAGGNNATQSANPKYVAGNPNNLIAT